MSEVPKAMAQRPASNEASNAHDRPFGLFRLPREIRDIIYEYTISEEGGLWVYGFGQRVRLYPLSIMSAPPADGYPYTSMDPKDMHKEANPLQYVCRRLNQETVGLTIRHNDLTFVDIKNGGAAIRPCFEVFTVFVSTCSSEHIRRLRRVILVDDSADELALHTNQQLKRLVNTVAKGFCLQFPGTEVIIRFHSKKEVAPEGYIRGIHLLSLFLRNHSPFPPSRSLQIFWWRPTPEGDLHPKNLRSTIGYKLNESIIRHELEMFYPHRDDPIYPNQDHDQLLEMIKQIHKNGI